MLLFPVMALFWVAFKRRHQFGEAEKLLWIWVVSLYVVFSIPSARSSRYLLPGMPALAVLCALNWERISRKAFVASLLVGGTAIAAMAHLCLRLQFTVGGAPLFPLRYWALLSVTATLIFIGLLMPEFTRPASPPWRY